MISQAILAVALLPALIGAADPISDGQWFHEFLSTAAAHAISEGQGVTVAVVDSGVDAGHPDLAGSVVPGIDVTGTGDGRVDATGHGTAMAGLVAAHGRVKGIAPQAKVLSVRTNDMRIGFSSDLARGITEAVSRGAKVISVSGGVETSEDLLLRQRVEAAIAADVVVVAAAGNNKDPSAQVDFPAAVEGVVAVGSVDKDGNLAPTSVKGPQVVIAAPGVGISSTDLKGGYDVGSGTSYATAIVAGAVALVRAKFPDLKAPEVIRRLTATATDKGAPGRDSSYGYGVLNLVAALTAELPDGKATNKAPDPLPPRFPWWTLAVIPVVGGAIILGGVLWLRKRS
jgi:type VII secretion-associated serine protease mycosin